MKSKPQITEAQRIADRLGAEGVVILAFGGDQVAGASYGSTKENCRRVGKWMDMVINRMMSGHMAPPYTEENCRIRYDETAP